MSALQQKAVDILRVVGTEVSSPHFADEWDALVRRYSEKAVCTKIQELKRRGYTDYGTSPRTAWLTEKGKEALDAVR